MDNRLLIPALGNIYRAVAPVTEPLIRFYAGLSLMLHGYPKLFTQVDANIAFFAREGFSPPAFWSIATGSTEFFGGLCLAIGLLTRVACLPILIFLLTAVAYHSQKFGFYWNNRGFEYPLFWSIVVFHFLIRGGGPWSVDAKIGREV